MKKLILTLGAMLLIVSGCSKINNDVVIKVNDSPITRQEVQKIMDTHLNNPLFAQMDKNSDNMKMMVLVAKDKATNELIVKKILAQEIAKRNITVSQEEFEKYKNEMIEKIGGEENIEAILKKNNMTKEELDELTEEDIRVNKLIQALSPVKISDKDVLKFYNSNKVAKFTYPDTVRASHILIKEEAKAKEVLAKAQAPKADFATLAKEYSEDPGSAQNGGDLGFFGKNEMVEPFSKAAFTQKPGVVGDLVKSEFGYHIILVTDRKKAGVMPFKEVKGEIKKYLEDEQKVKVLQKFIESTMPQVKIEYIDKSFDPEVIKKEVQKFVPQGAGEATGESVMKQESESK